MTSRDKRGGEVGRRYMEVMWSECLHCFLQTDEYVDPGCRYEFFCEATAIDKYSYETNQKASICTSMQIPFRSLES